MLGLKNNMLIRRIKPTLDPASRKRRAVKRFFWGVVILLVGIAGWVGITGALALKNITAKNSTEAPSFFRFSGDVPPDQLKAEGDGRINILLIGIGGAGHPGGQLADTIQIVSLDPINKTMSMLSIPRDLYVKIPNSTGMGKINSVYAYGQERCAQLHTCQNNVDAGADALKQVVSQVLNVPIHYFARVDFKGFEQFIDSLGGIQIYVDKPLNDPLFPDDQLKGYAPLYIPAGLQTFNGSRALKYARSRETTSDFDRAARQQKVIKAVKDKTLTLNIVANPKKLTDLITILGTHLKTDLSFDDMIRLANLTKSIDSSKTVSKVLDTSNDGPLKSTNDPRAGYIIVPRKGLTDYSAVQDFALTILQEPYLIKENAKIHIIDATGKAGTAKAASDKLKSFGYNVISTEVATTVQTTTTVKYFKDAPYTLSLLGKRLSVTPVKATTPATTYDIVVTLGSSYKAK